MNVRSLSEVSPAEKLGTDVGRHLLRLAPKSSPSLFGLGTDLAFLLLDLCSDLLSHRGYFPLPLAVCNRLLLLQEAVTFGSCLSQRILVTGEALLDSMYRLARLTRPPACACFTLAQDSPHRPEQKSIEDEYHCDNDRNMDDKRPVWHQLYRFGEG